MGGKNTIKFLAIAVGFVLITTSFSTLASVQSDDGVEKLEYLEKQLD